MIYSFPETPDIGSICGMVRSPGKRLTGLFQATSARVTQTGSSRTSSLENVTEDMGKENLKTPLLGC